MKKSVRRRALRVASAALSAAMLATGIGMTIPATALADREARGLEFIMVSDEIRHTTTDTERVDNTPTSNDDSGAGSDSGSNDTTTSTSGGGGGSKNNNGHGNNLDGYDSSNPGQGDGPNGGYDESDGVDDEAGGGSYKDSLNKNWKNNKKK